MGRNPFNQVTSKKCGKAHQKIVSELQVVIPLIRSQVKNPLKSSGHWSPVTRRNPFNQVTSKKLVSRTPGRYYTDRVVIPLIRSQVKNA